MSLFGNKESHSREKLFNSLIKNSDTIYLMYDINKRKILYMTDNLASVLKINEDNDNIYVQNKKSNEELINEIFELPILKEEIRTWDHESDFVSSMISYHSDAYKHTRYLKVKIYPIVSKKEELEIILISDATKEHDEQHLLVQQAADIKAREKQLNQITSSSYDIEIDINLASGEGKLRNLKNDVSYFGINRTEDYNNLLNEILEKYVNEEDKENVLNTLSLDNLKNKILNETEELSVRYSLNSEESIWLESLVFFTKNKGEVHVVILTKNVTENAEYMRRQNAMLQKALESAKSANKAKTSYLEVLSHEIRTPLNAIMGLSDSILNENLSNAVKEDVESISSASHSLLGIIDRLLDISKIESGVMELEEKNYNLPKMLKSFENIAKDKINNKNINLVMNVKKDIPAKLYGDSARISQVILNLIDNAVKFTEKGNINIDVDYEKNNNNGKLIISISDTGVGIPKEKLSTLFNESDDNTKYSNGMGLIIVGKLIDLLKAEIEVESEVGVGSKFTLKVPQKKVDDAKVSDINSYSSEKQNTSFNAKDSKVLIVDDNKLNLKVATRLLKPYEINVETANSGDECIEMIKNGNTYDLILLDQMMPIKDGVETLHELKMIKDFNTPVVVLTADAMKGKKEEYLSLGFNDYLSKPIDIEELSNTLRKYLKNDNSL